MTRKRKSTSQTPVFIGSTYRDLSYALSKITNNNAQNEYYITDSLEILISAGKNVGAYVVENNEVTLGANDRKQLNNLNNIMRRNINDKHMINGVDIPCTDGVMIGKNVKIGSSTVILPNTIILGNTVIGENCTINFLTHILTTLQSATTLYLTIAKSLTARLKAELTQVRSLR